MTKGTEQKTTVLPKADGVATVPLPAVPERPAGLLAPKRGVGLSLRYKIFGFVLLLVVAILASVLAVVQLRATAVTRKSIDAAMRNTGGVYGTFQDEAFGKISSAARQLADDPATKAAITSTDHQTLLDFLESKRKEALSADYLMALDARGVLLARTDKPADSGAELGDKSPLFSQPLQGKPASGFASRAGSLELVVSVPVFEGANPIGVLVVAQTVGAALATRAKELTNAEATFLTQGEKGLAVVSTTLRRETAEMLGVSIGSKPELLDPSLKEGKIAGPVELPLADDPNVVIAVPLASASGARLGLFVASRSLYQEMASYRQIRDTIVWVGAGAVLFALLLSFFMAARITRPIRALVEVTEAIQDGNLDVVIPDAPNDEIGMLTHSFARMLVELRQKAEMEQYLQTMSMQAVGGTMGTPWVPGGVTAPAVAGGTAVMNPAGTAPVASSASLKPGSLFHNRYDIEQILGAGAMGMVYRAKDRELDEEVAIKTIRNESLASDPTAIERFKQEIKLARKITNKHVLRTFDFGEAEGVRFITMEYMKSVTLKHLLEQKKALPLGPGLHLAKQICDGLTAAHEQGVIHRDIKPQNMLVNQRGDLKLMDFGISRLADSKGMTQEGMVIGTPDYMSPAQAQGKPLDQRSDIYSTGVVLYETFCGRLPFSADTALAMVLKHIQEAPAAPRRVNPAVPEPLEQIILKAMAKNPSERYQQISQLHEDLSNISS